ncbi:replicative DNA helicase [Candidatus Dojkabacteria bacterium]|nr:replicative DNA helicase [Candidatus Dojkabacteria bacterium]
MMATTYKLPPQDLEAEKSVLGALLMDEEAIIKVAEFLRPEHFYNPNNTEIYSAMMELFQSQKAIDVLTVSNFLKKNNKLKQVGGAGYLSDLVAGVPTSSHIEEYAHIVKDNSIRRRMITLSGQVNELAFKEDKKLEDILNQVERDLYQISEESIERDFTHISKLLEEAYERAVEVDQDDSKIRGLKTGFSLLDNLLGGFQRSDLIILAARPSVGKSALALDFARHIATREKKNVGVFSLEMSNVQLMDRLLAMQVNANLWDLRTGRLPEEVFGRLADAMGVLSESGLFIDDTPGINILEMATKARRLKIEKNLDFIVVDYLQLIEGRNKESRVQEVSEISRFLKQLARELDVPVLALSQLSRAVEQRTDRTPQLSDLRESGSIEQDADVVIFLNREEMYNPNTENKGLTELVVAKHRNGPTGRIDLMFVKEQARFRQIEKALTE